MSNCTVRWYRSHRARLHSLLLPLLPLLPSPLQPVQRCNKHLDNRAGKDHAVSARPTMPHLCRSLCRQVLRDQEEALNRSCHHLVLLRFSSLCIHFFSAPVSSLVYRRRFLTIVIPCTLKHVLWPCSVLGAARSVISPSAAGGPVGAPAGPPPGRAQSPAGTFVCLGTPCC